MQTISKLFNERKNIITEELNEWIEFGKNASQEELFVLIAYCICTPQNDWNFCKRAVDELVKRNIIFSENELIISVILKKNKVRFPNNKAKFIVQAREKVYGNKSNNIREIVDRLIKLPSVDARNEFFELNIKGTGMKESSHFIRDVGKGQDIAILDTHVLDRLVEEKVISEKPKSLSPREYIDIENRMRSWCNSLGIPIDKMDRLLWI